MPTGRKGRFTPASPSPQILYQDSAHASLPKGLIRDYPQYEVRACMLDVARFYMPLDYLGEITRYMAYFKLNEIRLHINDNGGENDISFRVESKRYPQINAGLSADEVYSQEDYRAYQKDALRYGIEVVTEIDTPAHSGFVKLARPDLSLDGFHIDLSKEDAIPFIQSLFDEFLDGEDPVRPEHQISHRHRRVRYRLFRACACLYG